MKGRFEITYDMNDSYEVERAVSLLHAEKWQTLIESVLERVRTRIKYEDLGEEAVVALSDIKEYIYATMEEEGLTISL